MIAHKITTPNPKDNNLTCLLNTVSAQNGTHIL